MGPKTNKISAPAVSYDEFNTMKKQMAAILASNETIKNRNEELMEQMQQQQPQQNIVEDEEKLPTWMNTFSRLDDMEDMTELDKRQMNHTDQKILALKVLRRASTTYFPRTMWNSDEDYNDAVDENFSSQFEATQVSSCRVARLHK